MLISIATKRWLRLLFSGYLTCWMFYTVSRQVSWTGIVALLMWCLYDYGEPFAFRAGTRIGESSASTEETGVPPFSPTVRVWLLLLVIVACTIIAFIGLRFRWN